MGIGLALLLLGAAVTVKATVSRESEEGGTGLEWGDLERRGFWRSLT